MSVSVTLVVTESLIGEQPESAHLVITNGMNEVELSVEDFLTAYEALMSSTTEGTVMTHSPLDEGTVMSRAGTEEFELEAPTPEELRYTSVPIDFDSEPAPRRNGKRTGRLVVKASSGVIEE